MPTTREFLGDSLIKELEGAGFSPQSINAFAKNEYRQRKAAQEEEQRRLLYRADDMKLDGKVKEALLSGEISEEEARNAQKFEDFGSKKHGWALGAAKTLTGIANTVERAGDFINPFYEGKRDKDGNYIYQNGIEKALRPKIKNVEKMRDDYEKATGETAWGSRLSEIGTELVGDPINFIGGAGLLGKGSKLAQFGKKTLYFAGTGAASGGVAALGEGKNDEETLKNIGAGAAGGFVLGHAIDQGIQGISKLIAKRQANKVAKEADAIESAENSEFLNTEQVPIEDAKHKASEQERMSGAYRTSDVSNVSNDELAEINTAPLARGGVLQRGAGGEASARKGELGSPAEIMTAKEFATKEVGLDEATATKVVKEAMQGKEKSDWTDADTYADIVKFKNFEIQRDYAKAYSERIQTAQTSINNAREQSAIRYADTQKAISEYLNQQRDAAGGVSERSGQKQGMSASAIRELINAKFKPDADEIGYTRAYNDGVDVDARLAGQGIFYALEKDIAAQAYTPEIYATRLKQRGFSDESVQAFTQAYINKDINIAKDYANSKVADAYENKIQREVANEIRDRDEVGGGFVNEEAKNNGLSDSVSDIGDNASRTGGRQASDEQILRQSGRNTPNTGQTKRTAQSDEQMEQRPAFKTDGDTDATAANKQMVEEQGSGDKEIRGENFITKESPEPKSDLNVKMDLAPNVRDLSKITADEISADLDYLASKHPEMFKKPSDVFKLVRDIKNEPTHFFNNYRLDYALVAKRLNDKKIGKLAINKESGEVRHATKVRERDLSRMDRVSKQMAGTSTLPTPLSTADNNVLKQDATSAGKAYSSADESIIPQKERNAKTINANSHIASGLVGGTLNSIDEDGNFNPEKFATGFLVGLVGSKAVAIAARKMTPQLYNKILGIAKKMPQMAKDNPKLLGKLYQNAKDVSINSFAGEKAITANVGKLDQAKAMLEKGENEVKIWQDTGWYKDKDGAWKFEIGDGKAKLNPNFQSGGRLGELLDHEELFKAYPELKGVAVVKIKGDIPQGASASVKDAAQREKRGIYNVTYNDKTATLVRQDLQKIDDALMLEKGSNKKGGAVHIKKHLEPGANGAVTQSELLNIGKNIREYLQKYKEPFIDENNGRIYEWADKEGVKFRVVVYEKADGISASHPNSIISFYSNRNLKKPMEFRNPQVKYDVNLRQWHKDSAPITKNADGSPKVFYHGTGADNLQEFSKDFDREGIGFWFSSKKTTAKIYARNELLPVYLNIKKPLNFFMPTQADKEALEILKARFNVPYHTVGEDNIYLFRVITRMEKERSAQLQEVLKQQGYDGLRLSKDVLVAFGPNQIKHVKNNGNFSDSPNIYKSGAQGYYNPARNEIGLSNLGDKSTLMHEVQHAIQEIEDFARGGNMAEARSYLRGREGQKYEQELKSIDKTLSNLSLEAQHMRMRYSEIPQDAREYEDAKELFRTIESREKVYAELSVLRDDLHKKLFEIDKKIRLQDIRETYRKIHGEAEARNVEARLNLSDKFRVKIVKDNNPAIDDNHTWIRDEDDIKTFKQAYNDDGGGDLTPDFTEAMAKKAIDSGEITVYSSKPIKAGSFVTPSKMEAKSYAGSGEIYEEKLNLNDISWIDALQGQVTRNKDIHPHETFDVNPNETFVSREDGVNLSHELEKKYILKDGSINEAAVRKEAEPFIEKEYSLENFKAEFPNGKVDTPIGEVDISSSQFQKLERKGREKYLGLIKPTLERPAFVVDFEDTTFFFKPFRDKDGVIKFASVIKERDGGLDVVSNYPMKNRKFELITREGKVRYVQGSAAKSPIEHSLDNTVRSSGGLKPIEHSSDGEDIIPQNEEKVYHSRRIEEIKSEHPNVEKELDDSIAAMRKESFNDSKFKDELISKIDTKEITTKQLGKSVDLSDKQLAVLKNDIKNADFKAISDSKIYFDKIGKDGDKKRFFIDMAEDGSLRVDAYAKSQIDNIPIKENALQELAGTGDAARLKNMSFEVKAAYHNELDPIKKEAILKTAEYNTLKKEMRGIYNVINNGKESANVYKDLQKIDEAIKLEQGSKKRGGGVHIQKHLDPNAKGAVSQQEAMNMGENMREYLKKYKEPFVDKDGGKIYEWQDKDGVRFRVAVYDKFKKSAGAGSTTRITTTDARENIITFYSDRNLNGKMEFLDPRVRTEAKFEEFKAKNLDENGNIKDGLSLC